MSSRLGILAMIPSLAAILLISVAIGVNRWQSKTVSVTGFIKYEHYHGLWQACNETTLIYTKPAVAGHGTVTSKDTRSLCYDISGELTKKKLKSISVVRNVLFAGLALMVLAILGTMVKHFVMKEWIHEKQQAGVGYITVMLAFLTGFLTMAAFAMYGINVKYEDYSFHAGFNLSMTAGILAWTSAAMFLAGTICIGA